MEIRNIPQPEGSRVETGPVKFGDDWPGLFIRGDESFYYAFTIRKVIEELPPTKWAERLCLEALLRDLESTKV